MCSSGDWIDYANDHYYRNRQKEYDFGDGAIDEWEDESLEEEENEDESEADILE